MTTAEITVRDQVLEILAELTTVPVGAIDDAHHLGADLGMDSVALMELMGLLDERFGVEVELEEVRHIEHVGTVVALIRERVDVS